MARPVEAFGLRMYAANSSIVTVVGSCYVFGADIQVRWRGQTVALGYLINALPSWYRIDAKYGMVYDLRFGRPGIIASITEGQKLVGAEAVADTPSIRIGASRAMQIIGERPQCGIAAGVNEFVYYVTEPTVGVPGCAVGVGSKTGAVQAAAGFTPLIALAGVPVYVNVTYQSPFEGDSTPQMGSSAFFYFRATDLPPQSTGTAVRLGDFAALTTPISVTFCINHAVTELGIFYPVIEEEANIGGAPTATSYSFWDMQAYNLLGAKSVPLSGGSSDVPIGFIRPNLPGTGFGFAEAKLGA